MRKSALNSQSEFLETTFISIPDLIESETKRHGHRTALIVDSVSLTFDALKRFVDKTAAALQCGGLGHGDCVAICAQSSIEYVVTFLAGLRAGIVVAPLPTSASPEALKSMIVDSSAQIIFYDRTCMDLVQSATLEIKIHKVLFEEKESILKEGHRYYRHWPAEPARPFDKVNIEPDWPFNIIYSSGTTGTPKGIVQSHAMRWNYVRRAKAYGYHNTPTTLLSTPLYSNTTLVSFFPTLAYGGTAILMPKFDAGKYLELAQEYKVTHTMLVPVQYQRIMACENFSRYDLSRFQTKQCTSSPFKPELKQKVLEKWPGGLFEAYGMTEGGATFILAAHEHPHKLHTVGLPVEGCEVRFINDQGEEVLPGEAGEIVGHSPGMMDKYLNQPEKTAEVEYYDDSGKRFIRSGDIGRLDEDGFLILLDRKKDMIISGGFNIYPSDLETVLIKHPQVKEVAVVGVPSEKWGETPVAFVVPVKVATITPQNIVDWTNLRLGKMQRLADAVIIDKLPRSVIGKVLKIELRATYLEYGHASKNDQMV